MKKFYFGLITLLLTLVAAPSVAQDYSVSLPAGNILQIGAKADFLTATTGGSDNDNWYLITQKRVQSGTETETPVYDNGTSTLERAGTDVTPTSLNGAIATDNAKYLVRFFKTGTGESYNIQFATGNFIQTTLVTGDQSTAGLYLLYNINGEAKHIGWNLTSDGESYDDIVDNNGAGYTLAFWDTGQVTYTDGNNDWCVYPVSFIKAENMCIATINYSYKMGDEVMYTYTKTQTGLKSPGLEVKFDAPAERLGVKCQDETRASETITENKTFDVTYTYTKDESVNLPFETTTVDAEGKYAEGTKWYYLTPYSGTNRYSYATEEDENVHYKTILTHPIDLNYMFCFTGNPLSGYQIHNYNKSGLTSVDGSSTVAFSTTGANYFLQEGYTKGYSFNLSTNAASYLFATESYLTIYTWEEYAYQLNGSAYDITEVTADELAQAIKGILTYSLDPEDGTSIEAGGSLDAVRLVFTNSTSATSVVVTSGMEEGKITLTDEDGNVVATPAYAINDEEGVAEAELDIIFDPEVKTAGKYYLNIPANLVRDNVSDLPNQAAVLTYTILAPIEPKTVTARIWKKKTMEDGTEAINWSMLPYDKTDAEGVAYYTTKVQIVDAQNIILQDWEGQGDDTDNLSITFDSSKDKNNVKSISEAVYSSGNGYWLDTNIDIDDYPDMPGCYVYYSVSTVKLDNTYGQMHINCYSYGSEGDGNGNVEIIADWYMDDRYAANEIQGKIYCQSFADLYYNNTDYPSFKQLPYGTDATYNVTVNVWNDSTITIKNYDGKSDIKLTFKEGGVTKVNDTEPDDYGTVYVKSSVLDGYYNGWYCSAGKYNGEILSPAQYDAETESGYVVLQGYDYSVSTEGAYRYIYIGIGGYTPSLDPTTGINEVKTAETAAKAGAIYNVAGQRLNRAQKGLNIVEGKKVVY